MGSNKKLNIINILIFILSVLPIVLVNVISRGNFIAGPFLTILFIFLMVTQIIMIILAFNSEKKWFQKLTLILNMIILVFMYWMLYGYIYDLK